MTSAIKPVNTQSPGKSPNVRLTQNITTLVFDLGGVLIELGDLGEMMASSPHSAEAIWSTWISSPSVRRFESGLCTEDEFARSMILEFDLKLSIDDFMAHFNAWPKGIMTGASELLEALSGDYRLACLSNTNTAHYESFLKHQPIMPRFEAAFLSHQMGCLKPDQAAFQRAISGLEVAPAEIAYFDDHPKNVLAATEAGLHAFEVRGPSDIRAILDKMVLA